MCKGCGKQSVFSDFPKMKFPKKVVEISVNLRHRGLTLRDVRKSISEIFEIPVKADSTIWYWAKRFAKSARQVLKGLADLLHADETLLKTFRKGFFFYPWAIKCPKTKQIVGWHLSEHRTLQDAKLLLWEARRRFPIDYFPKAICTDSMPAYRFAISSVFKHEVRHEKIKSSKHGNNEIENFFRCKRRFPKFRNLESARRYVGHYISEINE